jgi:hypothetical protein
MDLEALLEEMTLPPHREIKYCDPIPPEGVPF